MTPYLLMFMILTTLTTILALVNDFYRDHRDTHSHNILDIIWTISNHIVSILLLVDVVLLIYICF